MKKYKWWYRVREGIMLHQHREIVQPCVYVFIYINRHDLYII